MKLTFDDGTEVELSQELSEKIMNEVSQTKKEDKKETGFHDINNKGEYYFVDYSGDISDLDNNKGRIDLDMHNNFNAFTKEEFAKKIAFKQLMERKLLKFSLEHDGDKIDWNDDDQQKFNICYNSVKDEIDISSYVIFNQQGIIYFYSKEIAKAAIDEFYDGLVKYFKLDFR